MNFARKIVKGTPNTVLISLQTNIGKEVKLVFSTKNLGHTKYTVTVISSYWYCEIAIMVNPLSSINFNWYFKIHKFKFFTLCIEAY